MKQKSTQDHINFSGFSTYRRVQPGQKIVVIGAGPAGLTAAYILSKQGHAVTVLEADDIVGGISRTVQYKGYRFDIGGHRFFTKVRPVQALWEELLGKEFISVRRLSRIHYSGKYFDYPLRPWSALRDLGLIRSLMITWSYISARNYPTLPEENFEQWVSNRFGKRLYEIFFKTYTEKVWGIPCTEIRAEWAAQRIHGLSLARAILSATVLNKRASSIKSLIEKFQYPRLGPGQLWEVARDRVISMGNDVRMRHAVTAIHVRKDSTSGADAVAAVECDTPEGPRIFSADHVISTIPLASLVQALSPSAPAETLEAAKGLRYRDFILVALIIDSHNLFPDNWIYIHTPGVQVGRIQNFNNWSPAMVPEAGRTSLGMEYFCFKNDTLWNSSDQELIALASRELESLGLAKVSNVVDGTVIRMPKAYPIYNLNFRKHVDAIRTFINPITNLHTVGRNGMHKYNNQDHSMLTAMMAVQNMQGANHDIWAVNTDNEHHEEQCIEPQMSIQPQTL